MKMMKRIAAFALCLVIAAGMIPSGAAAKTTYKVSKENFYIFSSNKWVPKEETKYTYTDKGRVKKTVYGYDGIKLDNSRYRTIKTTKYTYEDGKIKKLQFYNTKGEKHGYLTYVYGQDDGILLRLVERRQDGTLKSEEAYYTKGPEKGKIRYHITYKTNGKTKRTSENYTYTFYKTGELKEIVAVDHIRAVSDTTTTTRYNKDGTVKTVKVDLTTKVMTETSESEYSYVKENGVVKTQTIKKSQKQKFEEGRSIRHTITEVTEYATSGKNKGKTLSISTSAQGKIKAAKDAPLTTNSFKEKKTYEYTYDKNGNLVQTISRINGALLEKYTYSYKKF